MPPGILFGHSHEGSETILVLPVAPNDHRSLEQAHVREIGVSVGNHISAPFGHAVDI
jgi:hypothetical protein